MTKTENVYWCDKHQEGIAKTSEATEEKCSKCGEVMKAIGWFEYSASDGG